jgi:hypothetical protein
VKFRPALAAALQAAVDPNSNYGRALRNYWWGNRHGLRAAQQQIGGGAVIIKFSDEGLIWGLTCTDDKTGRRMMGESAVFVANREDLSAQAKALRVWY